ncbi:Sec14p-like phosphatidylinositol transfer family protein [Perilla frutescens var. hirtella]|uniref:Sec14p-like phosphatidylinositol transfer family protein n=1 Tax=Perilla frutescens var. hirtella TaxID=608512 RepID=A0AAD4IWJ6_PERFH|nr:Sec14p-like phosphatidylinositol transfer family protein [Perilla frutescens var. hirtella]
MTFISEEMIKEFQAQMEKIDEPLKKTFMNVHNGYVRENLVRFLKAREGNISDAHKMLIECLNWRIQNEIDDILTKPINPSDLYRAIRDSQLVGMCGFTKEGLPVIAVGVGLSTYDKASINYYVQSHIQMNEYRDRVVLPSASKKYGRYIGTCIKILDMTGLRLSALNQMKLLSAISTIDDLNYPEKTDTYYIVNTPYIFSSCWKVVRPLLRERTRKKIQVLSGSGRDELLKIMDYESLPHFCRNEGSGSGSGSGWGSGSGSGSSRNSRNGRVANCYSLDHPFHQQLYEYIKERAALESVAPVKDGSVEVDYPEPDPEDVKVAQTIECEFQKLGNQNGVCQSLHELEISGD